jgi:predicted XRE-type DNA-binding protein
MGLADKYYIFRTGKNAHCSALYIFCSKFLARADDGCWEWKGKLFSNGYGCFWFKGKYLLAHRVYYEWSNDVTLSKNDVICHKCDNPKCVKPQHLICADAKFNAADKIAKGRAVTARGENAGNSKLSSLDVIEIRRLRYEENLPLKEIASLFKVSQKQISVVSRGVQWSHLK